MRAAEVVPDVATLMQDPEYTPEAALALSFMGSAAVAPLREGVNDDNAIVRREALRSLGKLRERASIDPQLVIPALLKATKDADASVRDVAVTYLGIVRASPNAEVQALIEALDDPQATVRRSAAAALAAYGAEAEPAIPALQKLTKDPIDDVQREAGRALVRIAELKRKTPNS
jgi:HEAT repeat protein